MNNDFSVGIYDVLDDQAYGIRSTIEIEYTLSFVRDRKIRKERDFLGV